VYRWSLSDRYVPVQTMDVLTMLGFIILIGVVVNNAILLVHQTLNLLKAGGTGVPPVRTSPGPVSDSNPLPPGAGAGAGAGESRSPQVADPPWWAIHPTMAGRRGEVTVMASDAGPLSRRRAVTEAVRTRVRPILMSLFTSVVGMMPLVVSPGAGSELYRGLGAVVLGGLIVSTVFTLVLVPLLLSLVLDAKAALSRRLAAGLVAGPGAPGELAAK
jgi:HAE1 family hydrophobic/amphiphilic exporter-1